MVNADGSKKLPPFIIGKAHKPQAFNNKTSVELGFQYRNNMKAWMTATLYQKWLSDWDRKFRSEDQRILLLQDNFSGHVVPETLTNIDIINFEPNLTAHVQPNDQGIIHCFKAKYHAQFIHYAIHLYKTGITPSQINDIDQLEAMQLTHDAWNEVDTTTIRNCWCKASILSNTSSSASSSLIQPGPSLPITFLIHTTESLLGCHLNEPSVVQAAENAVCDALDELEATGALQRSNQMDLAELLNPATEMHNTFEATDRDIYQAVMDAKAAWETNNARNSDKVDNDHNEPDKAGPTHGEALQAALVLGRYIRKFDDPFMCKLESMLGSVGKRTQVLEMQTMKDMKLTSYFKPK